jgi:membrane protein
MAALANRVIRMLTVAVKEFLVDRGVRLAAALSYYSIFSVVPLLFLVVAAAGFLLGDAAAVADLVARVEDIAGPEVGDSFESLLGTVREERGGALSVGIVLAAFTSSTVFQQIRGVLVTIFHVPESKRRSGAVGWLVGRAIGVVSAIVLAVLVFTPIAAVGGVRWLVGLLPDTVSWLEPILSLGIPLVSLGMLIVVAGLVLQALTPVKIPWRAAWRGGAATAIAGLSAAALVGVYLDRAGGTGTLGALGGAAILLFFFYLLWIVFIFGAEVTKVYSDYLVYGDIVQPSERPDRAQQFNAGTPGRIVPAAGEEAARPQPRSTEVASFVSGALLGWLLGRRD